MFNHIVFPSNNARTRFVIHVCAAGIVLIGCWLLLRRYTWHLINFDEARAFVRGFGMYAPLVFILLQAAQVVVAPVPGQLLGFLGGYLFGAVYGTLYSMIGITLGSFVAFRVARRFGRPYVEQMVHESTMKRFDTVISEKGTAAVFILFLIPGLPDDAICFLAGVTSIPIRRLVVLALIGRTPAFFIATLAGSQLARDEVRTAVALILVLVIFAIGGYLLKDELTGVLSKVLPRN